MSSEPATCIGWHDEGNESGITKYGISHYEPRESKAPINAPSRAPMALLESPATEEMLALMCVTAHVTAV